ncbi:MAG: hypothetical protein HZA11_12650, partial [Nitrospirae bacterium]|nr:hypothetical protein [Nitrospirota bacterium]
MKIFKQITLPRILFVLSMLFLVSCATTPTINLQQSAVTAGLSMELKQRAYIFTTMSLSPDGQYAVTGTTYNPSSPIRLWNVATGEQIWRVETTFAGITSSLGFSPDGKYIIAGGGDLILINSETGKIIRKFGGTSILIGYHSTVFSPDGKSLLAGAGGGSLTLWDVASGKKIMDLKGHEGVAALGTVNSVAFSPDGKYALSGGSDGTVRLWDLSTGGNIKTFRHSKKDFLGRSEYDVTAVLFMPDPRRVISWGTDGDMKIWDIESSETIRTVKVAAERFGVFSAAVLPDRQHTIVGTHLQYGNYSFGEMLSGRILRQKSVSLCNMATGKKLREYIFETPEWSQFGLGIILSPDGKRLFVAGDAAMRIIDASTLEEVAMLTAYEDGEWLTITSEG